MAVFAGIDEAGYGPILGPLVVSSSIFSIPDDLLGADLWHVLRRSVVDKRKQRAGRLLVCDSKKAYSKALGISHLQRTVLAFLRCIDERPGALGELLKMACPDLTERLACYPWYSEAGSCRITADEKDVTLASHVLRNDLVSGGIEFLGFRSCCLDVAYYNRMVAAVKNKAEVLFSATAQLIKHACDDFGADELQVVVDRQGGRVRHRRNLQRMFPDMELRILCENAKTSSYELKTVKRRMRLHFVVGADACFLPVSLASMVSKYLRELLVANINRYFKGFHAGLRPTAGYWKDGVRFVQDLRRDLPHIEFDASQLIRCR